MSLDLLERARAKGVVLYREGDQVHARVPGDPDPDLIDELRDHKPDVLAALREEEAERRRTIEVAVEMLFSERPEFRERRVGQVCCQLYLGGYVDFPVKDCEVAAVLRERSVVALA